MSIFGDRVVRVEDPKLLTDGGTYVADLRIPELDGAAHVTYVRSTVAHARLTSIEVDEARGAPGVLGVFTAVDIDLADLPAGTPLFNAAMTRPLLARDKVRFVGEAIAAIVTERPEQGADAAELVWPDYEPLQAVVTPQDALTDDVVIHEAAGTNLVLDLAFGHTDDLFDGCEVVVTQDVVQPAAGFGADGVPRRRGGMGRRPARPVVEHPARPRRARHARHRLRARQGAGAGDRSRCRGRVRCQDRRLSRGAAARLAGSPRRATRALGRDPQREHGRPRPRAGPAPDDRDRRPARRHRRGLPAHRAPGGRGLRRRSARSSRT